MLFLKLGLLLFQIVPNAFDTEFPKEIPVHFILVHPYVMPDHSGLKRAQWVAKEWKLVLRGYKITLWTDEMILSNFPELVPFLSQVSVPSWSCDVLKYHILLRYWGVYLDY